MPIYSTNCRRTELNGAKDKENTERWRSKLNSALAMKMHERNPKINITLVECEKKSLEIKSLEMTYRGTATTKDATVVIVPDRKHKINNTTRSQIKWNDTRTRRIHGEVRRYYSMWKQQRCQ